MRFYLLSSVFIMSYDQLTTVTRSYHGNFAAYKDECYFNPKYKLSDFDTSEFRFLKRDTAEDPTNRLPEADTATVIQHLKDLADAMIDHEVVESQGFASSHIAPGYTYWGQFIDHDLTAGTDSSHEFTITEPDFTPVAPAQVEQDIKNMRIPYLDLDSVYGDAHGPFGEQSHLYEVNEEGDPTATLRVGTNQVIPPQFGTLPNPELGGDRDLPRNVDQAVFPDRAESIATIGDLRNDENLLVAQFHLSFLKFHNAIVERIRADRPGLDEKTIFEEARQQTRFHYQWLVVNDFLPTICGKAAVMQALAAPGFFEETGVFMPLEFSTAIYRFGHSMVRNLYDYNQNFGRSPGTVASRATFEDLFAFTGRGATNNPRMQRDLPVNWVIEWDRFFDIDGSERDDNGILITDRFARRIDTLLAEELFDMANEDVEFLDESDRDGLPTSEEIFNGIMRHLARRNLLRGYLLSMPTGQALANACRIPVLNSDDLTKGNTDAMNTLMFDAGFLEATPLWYYVLKEAEVTATETLGPLGAHIVAGTIVGLIKSDPHSYLNAYEEWSPADGMVTATGASFTGIMDFLRFAGVAV